MPLYVFALGFIPGVAYASLYDAVFLVPLLFFLSLILLLIFVIGRRAVWGLLALGVCAAALGMYRISLVPMELPPKFVPLLETETQFEGVVTKQPDRREGSTKLTVLVQQDDAETRILASAPPHADVMVGDRVRVSGPLTLPEPFETDGGRTFAYDTFLAKDGVFALMSPAEVEHLGREPGIGVTVLRALQTIRDSFIGALARSIPEPESALAAGLIAGGKQGLGEELLDVFTVAGLIHIVVLSGSNVMIVAEAVLRMASVLPKRAAAVLVGVTIFLFVLAAGAGSAAMRAGTMALLGLAARTFEKKYLVIRALCLVLVGMLLVNPLLLIHDPGFQFSFVATLGLILLTPIMEVWFAWIRNGFMRDIGTATFAAQIAVMPLLLYQTGNLSIVSFAINLVVLPAIPPAMALGGVAGGFGLLLPAFMEPLVMLVGIPAFVVLKYVIEAARFAAALPFASVVVPAFPFWIVVLSYIGMGIGIYKSAPARTGALAAV